MKFLSQPMPLQDAIAALEERSPVVSTLRTAEWSQVPVALRQGAFFSAGVEHARFLETARSKLLDAVAGRREQVANGTANVDRSSFIGDMRKLALGAGISDGTGGLTDVAARARLGLIFDIQSQSAIGFSQYKFEQGSPAVLNAFPAQELLPSSARVPRGDWDARWDQAGGPRPSGAGGRLVALKTDPVWEKISRFGTPWPPFDFGSQRDLRDVDRAEAEQLGLIGPDDELEPSAPDFNQNLESSVSNLSPDLVGLLQRAFGDQIQISNGTARWVGKEAA